MPELNAMRIGLGFLGAALGAEASRSVARAQAVPIAGASVSTGLILNGFWPVFGVGPLGGCVAS